MRSQQAPYRKHRAVAVRVYPIQATSALKGTFLIIIIIIIIIIAKEQYIKRHDRVSAQLHFNICKEIWVQCGKC
jgi:hypothetical protein